MNKNFNKNIIIPDNIDIIVNNDNIIIKGILGNLKLNFKNYLKINIKDNKINIYKNEINYKYNINSYIVTIISLIKNMIIGVTCGFNKKLILIGIGYKFELNDNFLKINVGFSHEIKYLIPENIKIECINYSEIIIFGIDKQLVGEVASKIRNYRKPELYKGKGIRYFNEKISLKESSKKK